MNEGLKIMWKKAVISLCIISYISAPQYAIAATKILDYQIRQEIIRKGSVIISKPKKEDEKIYNILVENKIDSIEDYARWLSQNIQYRKDKGGDRWAKPMEVLRRKYGDCEDLALLNANVLQVLGYKPKFIAFYTSKEGHAVCLFQKNSKYYYFDNKKLMEIQESDFMQFAKNISNAKKYTEIKELNLETRKWNLVYKSS